MAKSLFKNIGYLGISQAANYLLPLVTIPYITRVVGPDNYGLIEFGTVTMLYFSALVIYGFTFTATRKIATLLNRPKRVGEVFSNVMYTRLLLFGVSTIIFLILLFAVPQFREFQKPLLFAYPVVLGWALYPDFLFQGLQQLKVVATANLVIKLLAAVFIFVLLHEKEDFYFVLGINSAAQVVVAVATLVYAFYRVNGLKLHAPKFRLIKAYLRSGWYIFLSHFFTRVYTFGSIIFLGFLLSEKELGLFAAAMKLVVVGQSFLFMPLGGALFPYLANKFKDSKEAYLRERRKFIGLMLAVSGLATVVILSFPDFFVKLVFGTDYLQVSPYLQLMVPILLITTLSHFALKQGLVILKRDGLYLRLVIATGLLSVALNWVLIQQFSLWGAAWTKLLTEAFLAVVGWWLFKRAFAQQLETSQK